MKSVFATMIALPLILLGLGANARGQSSSGAVKSADLAFGYTAIHANAPPPGVCGCFWMNGGSAQFAAADAHGLGLVVDFGMTTANNIGHGTGHDVTLATYLGGPRYIYWNHSRFTPYAQALVGAAHASTNYLGDNGSTTVAFAAGGGVDYTLTRRLSWRIGQVEYLLTHVPNGANNNQDQLRLTAGVVLRLK